MPADLVHTAGSQFQFQKRPRLAGAGSGFKELPAGFGFFYDAVYHKVKANGTGRVFRAAGADCMVLFEGGGGLPQAGRSEGGSLPPLMLSLPLAKEARKESGGFPVFGDQDAARRVLVEPVYQEGAGRVFPGQEAVKGDGYAFAALGRKAGGFIEHKAKRILVQQINPFQKGLH
jgi:hypothetical protein